MGGGFGARAKTSIKHTKVMKLTKLSKLTRKLKYKLKQQIKSSIKKRSTSVIPGKFLQKSDREFLRS